MKLTPNEQRIAAFLQERGPSDAATLVTQALGYFNSGADPNGMVRVHICNIRRKLGYDVIVTTGRQRPARTTWRWTA